MNLELTRRRLFVCAFLAVAFNAGCGGTLGINPNETGGYTNGGAANTSGATAGGANGSGGVQAGGDTSAGGTGTGGSTKSCADPGSPKTTADSPRRMLPWDLSVAGVDAGTTSDSGLPASGCAYSGGFGSVSCQGMAAPLVVRGILSLQFADGSTLTWDPTLVAVAVAAPNINDGRSVWVEYSKAVGIIMYGGEYWNATLQIRLKQGGQLLWIGQEGVTLSDMSDALANELFGVSVRTQQNCQTATYAAGCYTVQRTLFDHVLETSPEQKVQHATEQTITTPNGNYDVVWALGKENISPTPQCMDGPNVASDTGFAVSRYLNCPGPASPGCLCLPDGTWGYCTGWLP